MPNAHTACACGQPSCGDHDHGPTDESIAGRGKNRKDHTYAFFTEREIVLHRFLRVLIDGLALRLLCKSQEKVDENQCLDKDVPLESEIAQLYVVSYSASAMFGHDGVPQG